jgi:hypothetical protein
MKLAKVFFVTLVALTVIGASFAGAQTSYIGVFSEVALWDPPPPGGCPIGDGLSNAFIPPGVGVVDSLYVIAYNLNCLVTGIEFQVLFPPAMTWIADVCVQPVTFGTTASGLAMGWAIPQDGFKAINVATVIFQWTIGNCAVTNIPIPVVGHPLFAADPRWSCFQNPNIFTAVGDTGIICPTVPVEESTWGKVKALYRQ